MNGYLEQPCFETFYFADLSNTKCQGPVYVAVKIRVSPPPPFPLIDDFGYSMFGLGYRWRHVIMYVG